MTALEQLVENTHYSHSRNVAGISKIIAIKAGYSIQDASEIEQAALLHDIGKTSIPPGILNKKGKLSEEEYEVIKQHTAAGRGQIMEAVKMLTLAAVVAGEHHERLDGSGYCQKYGSEITRQVRLIAVCDVFDALVSKRSYKDPWDVSDAVTYLMENRGLFDQNIVQYLIAAISEIMAFYKNAQPALYMAHCR